MKEELRKRKNRFWAMLLAVVMIVGLMPGLGVKAVEYYDYNTATKPEQGYFLCYEVDDSGNTSGNGAQIKTSADSGSLTVRYYDVDSTTSYDEKTYDSNVNADLNYFTAISGEKTLSSSGWSTYWYVSSSSTSGDDSLLEIEALPEYSLTWNKGKLTDDEAIGYGDALWESIRYYEPVGKKILDYETFNGAISSESGEGGD